jgi:hypothetical protein
MTKIFVRERRHVGEGAGQPRFAVVAVQGDDLRFTKPFVRRAELEKIAEATAAEVVYLPRGEHATEGEAAGRKGRHSGRRARSEE